MKESTNIDWNFEPVKSIMQASAQIPFPEIPDNTKIRPLLNTEDLKLIRRAFICLAKHGEIPTDALDTRHLLIRMLRRTKKH